MKERVGQELLIPLLWFGDDPSAIPFDTLEPPYILKSSHASGHTIIVENKASLDETTIRETARNWLTWNHGKALDEPGYIHVPQALLIERLLLNRDGSPPIERKFIVFHGTVRVVQTVTVSSTDRARCLSHHHLDWTEIPFTEAYPRPTKSVNPPRHFEKMVEVAERMGAGLDHVRVDMYECNDEIYVGELTLYSNSGLQPFEPESADYLLGSYWDLPRNRMRAVWTMLTKRREIRRAFIQ